MFLTVLQDKNNPSLNQGIETVNMRLKKILERVKVNPHAIDDVPLPPAMSYVYYPPVDVMLLAANYV
jgi:hypothetical protein